MSSKKGISKKANAEALVPQEVAVNTLHKIKEKHGLSQVYVIGKTEGQKRAIHTILDHQISILHGVPGSGKSFLAIGIGLNLVLQGKFQRMVITRPYVEAGESLGYLPGSYSNKIAPFMYSVMDICTHLIGTKATMELIETGHIAVMPLAYLRGVTLGNAFVCGDEIQNSSVSQMRMLLTRMGENSKLVLTGDGEQSDLPVREGKLNGLTDAIKRLSSIEEIGFCEFTDADCVRSPLVSKIDKLYRNN